MMKLRDHIQTWVRGCHFEQNPEDWGGADSENCVWTKKQNETKKHESESNQSMSEVYIQGPQRTEF